MLCRERSSWHCKQFQSSTACTDLCFTLYTIDTHRQFFENIVGKGEIAHNEQFLLFPQCFFLNQITISPFVNIFDIICLFAAELEEPNIGIQGKG